MLRSALSAPKLMYTLRTSPCSDNPILTILMRFSETDSVGSPMSTLLISNGSRLLSLLKMGVLAYVVSPRWHLLPFWLQPLVPMNSSPLSCYGQTCRSLHLKGIQQDPLIWQARYDAEQPDGSEAGRQRAWDMASAGPTRIFSGCTQRIHTPEPGFWPHHPLTAEIGCWRFQSLHAACVLTMRLSGLRSV